MTRYKKYIKSKGYKFENDYPYFPHEEENVMLLDVTVQVDLERKIILLFNTYDVIRTCVCFTTNNSYVVSEEEQEFFGL